TLRKVGFAADVGPTARVLATQARNAGADGLVCSAHELSALQGLGGTRVVPGVRPPGADAHDQARVATPAEAVAGGATWIVLGRPSLLGPDPGAAARAIGASLEGLGTAPEGAPATSPTPR